MREGSSAAPQAQAETPAQVLARLEAAGTRHETPSGRGSMVWRRWGAEHGGVPVVLLHGGGGAWSHWVRNIPVLARQHTVWALDHPGLGDSAMPDTLSIEGVGDTIVRGLRQLHPGDAPVDLVGFSFGAPVASYVATQLGAQVRHFVVAGSRFIKDTELEYPTLVNWKAIEDPVARLEGHRRNLHIMMIANEANIDDLAVHIQATNTPKARFFGPKLDPLGKLHQYLPQVRPGASITGISGKQDQFARTFMHRQEAGLKSMHATARFHALDGAGHWVQYEAADAFNALLLDILSGRH